MQQLIEPSVKDILRKFEYNQHFQRYISDLLFAYPDLILDLNLYYKEGATKIDLGHEHQVDNPIAYFDETKKTAIIYVNS